MRPSKLVGLVLILGASTIARAQPADPYAAVGMIAGRWSVASSDRKATAVENICARTGVFFACQQSLDGKPMALVVFLHRGEEKGVQTYRTQALRADGFAQPGRWYDLSIKGADWIYDGGPGKPRTRTLNHFDDANHIDFEVQTFKAGAWETTLSGDETRRD